ncbi:MAG: anaerobic ribonucleoside-triphosphate reductase activating protein [Desulfovibrio sp.]|nr:anaerobic ribonucleoside-triphosphate reductase activating protein [Desulfovibrio sp.]
MRIGGLQKTTMLDFPGRISAVVFTQGCNFLCPYCHNPDLVLYKQETLALADVVAFLARRGKMLEGVVISGGEPTLHDALPTFCATLKNLGYAVKLDTNGSRPDVLRALFAANLLDYVAMDIKGNPRSYPEEIARNVGDDVLKSVNIIQESGIKHEFRLPCVAPFIDAAGFAVILKHVGGSPLFLQKIRLENVLRPDFFAERGRALDKNDMERLYTTAVRMGVDCRIR